MTAKNHTPNSNLAAQFAQVESKRARELGVPAQDLYNALQAKAAAKEAARRRAQSARDKKAHQARLASRGKQVKRQPFDPLQPLHDGRAERRPMSYADYLHSKHWLATRAKMLQLAQRRCEQCGFGGRLEVHHLHYEANLWHECAADLQVLCRSCHEKTHNQHQPA